MNICEGFNDWISCLKCKDMCTTKCPIEGDKSLDDIGREIKGDHVDDHRTDQGEYRA